MKMNERGTKKTKGRQKFEEPKEKNARTVLAAPFSPPFSLLLAFRGVLF
jgi:hypothetical protein